MLIDWFTVGAQIVNFAVLVWLMKRFLYGPILNAIEKRRQEIASVMAEARADQERARQESDEFRRRNEDFEDRRARLLEEARTEAGEERTRLMDEARRDVEQLRQVQREALREAHERLEGEIARRIREEVFAIARKALADLAGSTLEDRAGEVLCRRLRELDAGTRDRLAAAVADSASALVVRSAFEVSAATRQSLTQCLHEWLPGEISFHTEPDLIGGFEILFGEQKLAWNIESHLEGLREHVVSLIPENTGTGGPDRPGETS